MPSVGASRFRSLHVLSPSFDQSCFYPYLKIQPTTTISFKWSANLMLDFDNLSTFGEVMGNSRVFLCTGYELVKECTLNRFQ